jgi:sulfite exporter TauE/SafE
MLPWAMVMKASSSQNVFHGLMTMVLFGLGTIPVLFFTGFFASLLSYRLRILGERLAGLSVIAMGGMLVFKGLKYFLQGLQ